jgi:hypothetical protein
MQPITSNIKALHFVFEILRPSNKTEKAAVESIFNYPTLKTLK